MELLEDINVICGNRQTGMQGDISGDKSDLSNSWGKQMLYVICGNRQTDRQGKMTEELIKNSEMQINFGGNFDFDFEKTCDFGENRVFSKNLQNLIQKMIINSKLIKIC